MKYTWRSKTLSKDLKKDTIEQKGKLVNEHNVIFKVQIGTYLKSMKSNNIFMKIQLKMKKEFKLWVEQKTI